MTALETLMRKRVTLGYIMRNPTTITISRTVRLRNSGGGLTPQTPTILPDQIGRVVKSALPRHKGAEMETSDGMETRDFDRLVLSGDADLVAGDVFQFDGSPFRVSKVLPHSWRLEGVIERQ